MNAAPEQILPAKAYFPNLDGVRFIMCLGIAVFHLGPYFFGRGHNAILKCDYFTDVFFILSAYLLARSNNEVEWTKPNYLSFLKKRIIRLYPLYLASLAFFILIAVVTAMGLVIPDNPARYELGLIPYHLLLIQSWGFIDSLTFNYVAWAISALWLMYIFFPTFVTVVRKYPVAAIIAVAILLVGIDYATTRLTGLSITGIQKEHFGFLRAIPSFLFGVWLVRTDSFKIKPSVAIILFWVAAALLFLFPVYLEGTARFGLIYPALFFLIVADIRGSRTIFTWSGFKKLAPYSYGIFLLHTIIATVFLAFLMPRIIDTSVFDGPYGWLWASIGLLISLILSLIAGIIGYHLVEKPAADYLKKYI